MLFSKYLGGVWLTYALILLCACRSSVLCSFFDIPIVENFRYLENNSDIFDESTDLRGNRSLYDEIKYGCLKWGGRTANSVMLTSIVCHALDNIECYGNRTFLLPDYPCLHFKGHYFVTTFIYSLLLGFLGVDRLCLGHIGTGIGKLLTLGGAGIWWLVDIVLLIRGDLSPADGSSWMPFY
ncbi:unnamed protein product [Trichobilharzia regenti]|nr:unnamed protein product [Trichobilharzia regenti]